MIKLLQGDCLDRIKELDNNSVDTVLCDPPYIPPEHSKTLTKYKKTLSEMGILESFYKTLMNEINRVLRDDGRLYFFCNSDSYAMFYIHMFPYVKKMRCFVWDKINCSLGFTFRHQHELILYGERTEAKPIKCGTGDIFKFKAVKANDKDHPAQKPTDLLQHILSNHKEGTILDPFMGTGSVGLACKNLNLNYIGIEIEPQYYKLAEHKLLNFC